jgi:putative addiction module component (TIGR02574 family)
VSVAEAKLAEALALPKTDRAFLARELILSLDEERDTDSEMQWREAIDRRTKEMGQGNIVGRSLNEVLSEIRGKFNASR